MFSTVTTSTILIVTIVLGSFALVGLALIFPAEAHAQGCAMCKLSAEAAGERTARALDYGIFILLTPAVLVFLGVFYWAFAHRDETLADQMEAMEADDAVAASDSAA